MSGIQVKVKRGQKAEKALRLLKKKMLQEGIFDEVKKRKYFEKPSQKRKKQKSIAKFNNRIRNRNNA